MLAGVSLRAHPWVPELGGQTCPRVAVSPGVVPFPQALPSLHSGWVPLVFTSTVPGWRHGCVPRFSQAHPWLGAFSPCSPCLPEVCPSRRRRPICTMSCRGLPKPTPSIHLHHALRRSAQSEAVDPFAPCLAEVCPSRHLRSICTMSSGGLSKPAPSIHLHHVFRRSAQADAFDPSAPCFPEVCPSRRRRPICTMSSRGLPRSAPSVHLQHVFRKAAQAGSFCARDPFFRRLSAPGPFGACASPALQP